MSDGSTLPEPSDAVDRWWRRLRTLGYGVFFPLLLVVALIAPLVVASTSPLTLFEAAEYTFVAVGVGYVVGLALLLR